VVSLWLRHARALPALSQIMIEQVCWHHIYISIYFPLLRITADLLDQWFGPQALSQIMIEKVSSRCYTCILI